MACTINVVWPCTAKVSGLAVAAVASAARAAIGAYNAALTARARPRNGRTGLPFIPNPSGTFAAAPWLSSHDL